MSRAWVQKVLSKFVPPPPAARREFKNSKVDQDFVRDEIFRYDYALRSMDGKGSGLLRDTHVTGEYTAWIQGFVSAVAFTCISLIAYYSKTMSRTHVEGQYEERLESYHSRRAKESTSQDHW